MNIKEASKTAGVTPRTLYYYEEVGLLSPAREENGYRVYSEADVTQARMIRAYPSCSFHWTKSESFSQPRAGSGTAFWKSISKT